MAELGDEGGGEQPAGGGEPPGELSPEERAALPQDSVLRRLVEDRRVRIAAIAGIPLIVALCAAAAIFAHSFGLARSIRLDGPAMLVPGGATSVRVGYAELDDYGLPHALRVSRVRLEVCDVPPGAAPAVAPAPGTPPLTPGCLLLGDFVARRGMSDVTLQLQVPDVPDGVHPVRVELVSGGRTVAYRFPARFDRAAGVPPERRENGRSPVLPLGSSGIDIDLVPFDGGIARGWTSALILRAVGPDGLPYDGTLYLLPIGELGRAELPPSVPTDAAGLASFALHSETFEYRLAISAAPYPVMDPLEVDVGLLPEEVLAQAVVAEIPFRPMVAPLRVASTPTEVKDHPFLRAGDPLFLFPDRDCDRPTPVLTEIWEEGRLLRLGDGTCPGGPLEFGDFRLPAGLVFVQVHRPGDPVDSVTGRTVWAGRSAEHSAEELAALLDAVGGSPDERPWRDAVRARLAVLDGTTRERLGRYVLGRLDARWYAPGTLFDSRPIDQARVDKLRDEVKAVMAWGIGTLACALLGLAGFVGFLSVRDVRRQRAVEAAIAAAAPPPGPDEPRASIYDRPSRGGQGVLLRMAVVFFIVALALAGIAFLVWGMKQTYLNP